MITSIFNKSKPINFIIVIVITLFTFLLAKLNYANEDLTIPFLLKQVFLLVICLATLFLLNFIVTKNNLSKQSSYHILLFSLFLAMFPLTILNSKLLASNFFVLLAMRRVISLRSQIEVKKKLFDTAFWVAIASLFYFWSILFLLLIFLALIFYSENKPKNWIVPLVGILSVYLIGVAYLLINGGNFGDLLNYFEPVGQDFSSYNNLKQIIAITIIFSFGLWASFFYLKNLKSKLRSYRPSFVLTLIFTIIAFVVAIISPLKNGSEFIFVFAPLSIIITNYIEVIEEKWFKELFVITLIIVPIVLLIL